MPKSWPQRESCRHRPCRRPAPPCSLPRCRKKRSGREIPFGSKPSWWTWKDPRRTPRYLYSHGRAPQGRVRKPRASPVPVSARIWFSPALLQLLEGQLHFGGRRRRPVELGIVLHEGDALSLYGVGHNTSGTALGGAGLIERAPNGSEIVAIDLHRVPPKGSPFIRHRRNIHDVFHEAVELDAVVVQDRNYIIDLVKRSRHGRFPDLPFLAFAIAQHHIGAARAAVQPVGQTHA